MDDSAEPTLEAGNRTYHEAQDRMALLPNYYAWSYGAFRRYLRGDVMEIGCGAGLGIRTYAAAVDHIYAVDFNQALLDRIAATYPARKVTPIQADLLADWRELDGITVQTVIMMDVLEHFADDAELLRQVTRHVAPGGHLCVKVPAQRGLYSAMDRASGHYRRYDRDELVKLGAASGLRLRHLRWMNPVGALAYRRKNRQSSNFSRSFSPLQLRLINLALPGLRMLDAVQFVPGLSLVAVFQCT